MILISIICQRTDLAEKLNVIWVRSQLSGLCNAKSQCYFWGELYWADESYRVCLSTVNTKQVGDDEDPCPQLCTVHWAACRV